LNISFDAYPLKDHGGVSIKLSEMGDFFRVELLRSSVGSDGKKKTRLQEKLQERLQEKFPVLQQTIIENMSANPDITYARLVALTGKSQEAIRRNINQLKQKGVIERIGSDRGGRWRVHLLQKAQDLNESEMP
jgi:ATP-dependent DNA helicase RecG